MDEREQLRKIRHRLSVLRHADEVSGNVAATCRYYGISRPTFYKWLRQYEEFGDEGLRDRSSRPKTCPHQTDSEVVSKIVYLRQHYHFGPAKISMYLARYHEVTVSKSGVWRILKRLDMNRLPTSQRYKRHDRRWKRYEKQLPGHRVQVDVKFIEPIAAKAGTGKRKKRYYQFTAIDDCTRIRVLRIFERNTQKSAIQFIDYVLAKLPFQVEVVQTDNGSEFQGGFHWHLLDRGIGHVYIKPRTPRLNGKVERSHRIDNEEFYRMLEGVVIDDAEVFNGKLQEWEDFYNFNRPSRGPRWTNPIRTLKTENNRDPAVNHLSQLHRSIGRSIERKLGTRLGTRLSATNSTMPGCLHHLSDLSPASRRRTPRPFCVGGHRGISPAASPSRIERRVRNFHMHTTGGISVDHHQTRSAPCVRLEQESLK